MGGRRVAAMLAMGVAGAGLIVALLLTPPPTVPGASSRPGASPGIVPSALPPADPLAPLISPVTVVDGLFDDQPRRSVLSPTSHKNQSKLFFADGTWWGVLQEPTSRESRIQYLDWATQRWHDTGIVVDDRSFARADVLYTDDTLYITSSGSSESPAHAIRVSVFDYDRENRTWVRRPDFPVTINATGVESSLIDLSSDGRLWVAYIEGGGLFVTHSTDDVHRWVTPYRPIVAGTDVATDQVGMVTVSGEVVLLWSNQNDEAIYASSLSDGASDDDWAPATTVLQGLRLADNHVNMKALADGRIFAAIKTSLDTVPNAQPGWDQILLLTRQDGIWSSTQLGQLRDKHTRPIVVLDQADSDVLVFVTAPTSGGAIYMKRAPFDRLRFPTGRGVEVLGTSDIARINDATSTKQPVDATTGLVVLAADDSTGRYVHLAASLGGPAPGVPQGETPPDGPVPAPDLPVILVDERSDVFRAGDRAQPEWRMAPTRDSGTVTYVRRDGDDLAIRLRTTGRGELRPCRGFGTTRTGRIEIAMDVRVDRQGAKDTILLMARGDNQELAAIRLDDQLRVRISREGNRDTTKVTMTPGRWYRVILDLDIAAQTFDVRLLDAAGATLLSRTAQPWRSPGATRVDGLCVAASIGASGQGMSLDDLKVTRFP